MKNYLRELFHLCQENEGNIVIPNSESHIRSVKSVEFTEEHNDDGEDSDAKKWNAYVDRVRAAIGTTSSYTEWIRNEDFNMMGVMQFYDKDNNPIKTKYITPKQWKKIYNYIKNNKSTK